MSAFHQHPVLFDAHNHLADARFDPCRSLIGADLDVIPVAACVVNGTAPRDWSAVLDLAALDPRVVPAVGLHPWRVNGAPPDWRERFVEALDSGVRVIGEIGLDRWIEGHDPELQKEAFCWQFAHAVERDLPASIHCLKALGPLMEILRAGPVPQRGFHLHAYSGPVDLVPELLELGAYFSFNGGQLLRGREKVRSAIRAVPAERILIETDAPDFLPPEELREYVLPSGPDGGPLCHPGNLRRGYEAIAAIRSVALDVFAVQVAGNFDRFFGHDESLRPSSP